MGAITSKQQGVVDRMQEGLLSSVWILRISEQKQYTGPVLTICEKVPTDGAKTAMDAQQLSLLPVAKRTKLKEWGRLFNGNLRACLPAIRSMMNGAMDDQGRALDIASLLDDKINFRGQIPLDETTGGKLSLLFRLQGLVRDTNRAELMAWRIARFSREETMYWLTRVSSSAYGKRSVEWAKSGLRIMLAGQQNDKEEVQRLLEQLRK